MPNDVSSLCDVRARLRLRFFDVADGAILEASDTSKFFD